MRLGASWPSQQPKKRRKNKEKKKSTIMPLDRRKSRVLESLRGTLFDANVWIKKLPFFGCTLGVYEKTPKVDVIIYDFCFWIRPLAKENEHLFEVFFFGRKLVSLCYSSLETVLLSSLCSSRQWRDRGSWITKEEENRRWVRQEEALNTGRVDCCHKRKPWDKRKPLWKPLSETRGSP